VSDYLRLALRAHTEPARRSKPRAKAAADTWRRPRLLLVFDTETEIGPGQGLLFGSARLYRYLDGQLALVGECLFHADDLDVRDPEGLACMDEYAFREHLPLLSRREFCDEVLWPLAFKARAWVVGFNLPFDLSRLAIDHGEATGRFLGGFSFELWGWTGPDGIVRENMFRPRLLIKALDSKRAFIEFARPMKVDWIERIPDDSPSGRPEKAFSFKGELFDARTGVYALTAESHSLVSACELFGIESPKLKIAGHGEITPEYIGYNRNDVRSTARLTEQLLAEYSKHPIALPPTEAYSPASIGKAYLDALGLKDLRERERGFPRELHGFAMGAYYGGRAECRIRKTLVPVVTVDFLSAYSTVNALMGIWELISAERIEAVEATKETRLFLRGLTLDACFDPKTWKRFPVLCLVEPDGEILPARCDYGGAGSWQIGVNPLRSNTPLWYALPELVAAWLLSRRVPRVLRAVRLVPRGRQPGLRPVKLREEVAIDPVADDPYRVLIEERKRLSHRQDLTERERVWLSRSLKTTASAIGYGIFAEISRSHLGSRRRSLSVYGLDESFTLKVSALEKPGRFSFPPIAACVTAAARLLLALLERLVTDGGGSYVCCDTDSMAIVANEQGGLVRCPSRDGETIRALSWRQVEAIVERFSSLNPYDRTAIPGSILQIEPVNYDEAGEQRPLYAFAISAKRYALATLDCTGQATVVKRSEHGLGHLLNPLDPEREDRDWNTCVWQATIDTSLGRTTREPAWASRPAVSRVSASSPTVLHAFDAYNEGRAYAEQIKPFNFLLAGYVAPFGHPNGYDPERFQLIAPYETDPRKWLEMRWSDRHSGDSFPVHVQGTPSPDSVKLKNYGHLVARYRRHPEPKSLDPSGAACHGGSIGQLERRPVRAALPVYIGKESNYLEERQAGLIHSLDETLATYYDPRRDVWRTLVVRALQGFPTAELASRSGLHRRTIERHLSGRAVPHRRQRAVLTAIAVDLARSSLDDWDLQSPREPIACLTVYRDARDARTRLRCCVVCGAALVGRQRKYCSDRCKKRAYRARSQ
jgi:hypothetical protein